MCRFWTKTDWGLNHFWTIIEQRSTGDAATHNGKTAASTMTVVECCSIVFGWEIVILCVRLI